jgi:ABC-2 type transport system permease protein
MRQILAIAQRELRGYFVSPVALIFLGIFLILTLFFFFWLGAFFSRNLADVRPLFIWLPLLLIFLVSALTMRLWSDEQRSGTMEILFTLPIPTWRMVLGKFAGGLVLIAIALALTLGLPVTVSMMGDLDWGPVIGGYLGALLLASSYLAIGLFASALTANSLLALLLAVVFCLMLYLPGMDAFAGLLGNEGGEIARRIGMGSRFASVERGVIDLRDLIYYLSITVAFLVLNVAVLKAKRWSNGVATRALRGTTKLTVLLVATNLVLTNVLIASRSARIDMTQRKEYSVSEVTTTLLRGLEAPLLLRGYFSDKTHPLLAPLVPRLKDLMREYGAVGGSRVTVDFIDPRQEEKLEKEANEDYGVKSVPFQFADRHEAAVVNSYFTILVKFGDKYEKLSFQDLIEVKVTGPAPGTVDVKLRNPEYDLTRTIKKVVYGFQPLEQLFASVSGKVQLTGYITPKTLPENLRKIPGHVAKASEEIKKRSAGKFVYKVVDPSGADNTKLREQLFQKHGFQPLAASLLAEDSFYLHLLLQSERKTERLYLNPEASEADVHKAVEAALKRLAPGFIKTVGLLAPPKPQRPMNPYTGRQPETNHYQLLRQKLSESYEIESVDLKDGRVPSTIDVLVLPSPKKLDAKQRFAVDQFLMRGGSVAVFSGAFDMDPQAHSGLAVRKAQTGLEDLLASWGVKIEEQLVLDRQNEAFPVPVTRDLGGLKIREIQLLPYPFFVDVRPDGMEKANVIVSGLPSVTMQWASPLSLTPKEGLTATVLLKSSEKAWTQDSTEIQPPKDGFAPAKGQTLKAYSLAVALTGEFRSSFEGKPNPLLSAGDKAAPADDKGKAEVDRGTIKKSPKTARLVVVGSSEFINDNVLDLSRQTGSERFMNNLQLTQNIVDWSVADTDLLTIRSRGAYARTLKPMAPADKLTWEVVNGGLAAAGLGLIVLVTLLRRRQRRPMSLVHDLVEGSR